LKHLRRFTSDEQLLIQKAFESGKKAHEGQKRKSGEPYFTHPTAVAEYLIDIGADVETVIAALLHDTVEDTNLTLDAVNAEFGPVVARMVDGVTKLSAAEMDELPTLDQKIETLRKMFTLMQEDARIMMIKLMDRLHNMQTISYRKPESQKLVAKETLDIYVKIADRLCMRDLRNELEYLCYAILEPETHESIKLLKEKNRLLGENELELIRQKIADAHPDMATELSYEKKSWENLHLQYELQKGSINHPAVINIVFRCSTVEDCYKMLGIIHILWPRESRTFDDFINIPVINGYKGIHTTIIVGSCIRMRCKIRTYEMDEYAHNGIATKCFGAKAEGILSYLPWTQHIQSLSDDTKNRSSEFWESLQSDILSESMLLYGIGNKSSLIPKGSTALDGVFYLYPEDAIYISSIRVNGKAIPFSQKLENGVLLEITKSHKRTINREWLYRVQTGLSIGIIRAALAEDKNWDLESTGKDLLQEALTHQKGGYLEEFDQKLIDQCFFSFGYRSTHDAYVAIANRHLEPVEVVSQLFHLRNKQNKKGLTQQKEHCRFTFDVDRDVESLRNLLSVYDTYNVSMKDIRLMLSFGSTLRMRVSITLTPDEQESYRQELIMAGARDVTVDQRTRSDLILMFVVVVCWALNPVWAKYYLTQGMSPMLLVSLRSFLFFFFSSILFLVWKYRRGNVYSPIPHITRISLVPAISTFIHSLLTYLSVSLLVPSVHLTVLRFNILLLPVIHLWKNKDSNKRPQLLITGLCLLIIIAFLFAPGIPRLGLLFAMLTLISYLSYSLITEKTLQQQRIGLRYPQYLFHLSFISALIGLALSPLLIQQLSLWTDQVGSLALYVLFCVFIPHTCFHIILQRTKFKYFTSISLLEVPLAMAMQFLILGLSLPRVTNMIIIAILGIFLVFPFVGNRRKIPV